MRRTEEPVNRHQSPHSSRSREHARVIPGVGTVKIFFDIERGIVNVTVGWALNQANAALVDALYTGEAGRTNEIAAGTVGGRIRDSGICVLDPPAPSDASSFSLMKSR